MTWLLGYLLVGVVCVIISDVTGYFFENQIRKGMSDLLSKDVVDTAFEEAQKIEDKRPFHVVIMFKICGIILWPLTFSLFILCCMMYFYSKVKNVNETNQDEQQDD